MIKLKMIRNKLIVIIIINRKKQIIQITIKIIMINKKKSIITILITILIIIIILMIIIKIMKKIFPKNKMKILTYLIIHYRMSQIQTKNSKPNMMLQ